MIDLIAELFCVAGFLVCLVVAPVWAIGLLRGGDGTPVELPSDHSPQRPQSEEPFVA